MKLKKDDWVEIYYALELKLDRIKEGLYGDRKDTGRWANHLDSILQKIGPDGEKMWNTTAIQTVHEYPQQPRQEKK